MGRGDKRTAKGKRTAKSYGNSRPTAKKALKKAKEALKKALKEIKKVEA